MALAGTPMLTGRAIMSGFPPITVRQPRPFDIVDDPVRACGVGTGFEGVFTARVRDGHGAQIAEVPVNAGGTGVWGNYDVTLPVGVPSTAQGTLEVFEFSPKGDGSELNKVVVPITFGPALLNPYNGFAQYTVVGGDTLSGIAKKFYSDANRWPRIFEANRHQIQDPDRIFAGQVLRVPQ
jgi:nucleoid-associated protein YgaU